MQYGSDPVLNHYLMSVLSDLSGVLQLSDGYKFWKKTLLRIIPCVILSIRLVYMGNV